MAQPNSTIEDVCAVIGFTATTRLIDWFGGNNIYVPSEPSDDHTLACLIGMPAMRALCLEFGDLTVWIPATVHTEHVATKKQVAELFRNGGGSRSVSAATGLSQRHVQRLRRELEESGLVPQVLTKNVRENAHEKNGGGMKNRVENAVGKTGAE